MLEIVKLALRIKSDAFDEEIQLYIDDCLNELYSLGIDSRGQLFSPQIQSAVIAYAKWHFGENDQADKWKESYSTKVAQLQIDKCYQRESIDG